MNPLGVWRALLRLGGAGVLTLWLSFPLVAQEIAIEAVVTAAGGEIESTTLVIQRLSDSQFWIANPARARQRFSPASTSKIPHSLIALEHGITTRGAVFQWDGLYRSNRAWNRDQTLETAFQDSVVWVFQDIARSAGQRIMSDGLLSFAYGNANVGAIDQLTTYWLDGTLSISALEQVDFLSKLVLERLPLSENTYAAARDIMVSDMRANWTMRSKTGWRFHETEVDIGWYVGWLECRAETYVFALNMDLPYTRFLPKRKSLTYHVLNDIGAFDCT